MKTFKQHIVEMAATPEEKAFLRNKIESLLESEFVRRKGAAQAGKVIHPHAFHMKEEGKKITYEFIDVDGHPTDIAGGGNIPIFQTRQRIYSFFQKLSPLIDSKFYLVAYNHCVDNDNGDKIICMPQFLGTSNSYKHFFYSNSEFDRKMSEYGWIYRKAGYIQLLDVNTAAKVVLNFSRVGEFQWAKIPLL